MSHSSANRAAYFGPYRAGFLLGKIKNRSLSTWRGGLYWLLLVHFCDIIWVARPVATQTKETFSACGGGGGWISNNFGMLGWLLGWLVAAGLCP